MEVIEFINTLKRLALDTPTRYLLGATGQHDGDTFLFDCCTLIKCIIWGFDFDYSKYRGGAIYESNGLPDVGANRLFIDYCYNISFDFTNIEVGEIVWLEGHVGVYIGDNKVIECTPAWENKVLVSNIDNKGLRSRNGIICLKWTHHGKFNKINYNTDFKFRVHFSNTGWTKYYGYNEIVESKENIEAIEITSSFIKSGKTHITKLGWVDGILKDNTLFLGTTGKSLWIEAIQIDTNYNLKCMIKTTKWNDETKLDNVITLGSVGMSRPIHAIKFTKA